jgi:O-antigen/teichoic acid export membrane protein
MAREVATAKTRRFGRSAAMLSIGVGSAGLLTYVYFSLASHNLSKTSYGEIVVLWSAVFVTISILFRPVEQLLSRTIADRQARGETIGGTMRVAATIQLGLALAVAATALLLRDRIQNDLLSGSATL